MRKIEAMREEEERRAGAAGSRAGALLEIALAEAELRVWQAAEKRLSGEVAAAGATNRRVQQQWEQIKGFDDERNNKWAEYELIRRMNQAYAHMWWNLNNGETQKALAGHVAKAGSALIGAVRAARNLATHEVTAGVALPPSWLCRPVSCSFPLADMQEGQGQGQGQGEQQRPASFSSAAPDVSGAGGIGGGGDAAAAAAAASSVPWPLLSSLVHHLALSPSPLPLHPSSTSSSSSFPPTAPTPSPVDDPILPLAADAARILRAAWAANDSTSGGRAGSELAAHAWGWEAEWGGGGGRGVTSAVSLSTDLQAVAQFVEAMSAAADVATGSAAELEPAVASMARQLATLQEEAEGQHLEVLSEWLPQLAQQQGQSRQLVTRTQDASDLVSHWWKQPALGIIPWVAVEGRSMEEWAVALEGAHMDREQQASQSQAHREGQMQGSSQVHSTGQSQGSGMHSRSHSQGSDLHGGGGMDPGGMEGMGAGHRHGKEGVRDAGMHVTGTVRGGYVEECTGGGEAGGEEGGSSGGLRGASLAGESPYAVRPKQLF
ncbi:hypothetical protein CLOP_g21840 [Closterium sp. NIES-67]|nr:hypothetical protein CLOP_g21840 [Closterium sp. NIES-67]